MGTPDDEKKVIPDGEKPVDQPQASEANPTSPVVANIRLQISEVPHRVAPPRIDVDPSALAVEDMRENILRGLRAPEKYIEAKFFYDERGSQLFDQICQLLEYYPTRTEKSILTRQRDEICEMIGSDALMVEYGSGSSDKIRILLEGLSDLNTYMPIDISQEHLREAANRLHNDFPALRIHGLAADYTKPFSIPAEYRSHENKTIFFPGSTIGNFTPQEAKVFLRNMHSMVGAGGKLIIGVDTKKDEAILNAAYNDAAGVTARFNLNILSHIKRKLGGTLDENNFKHVAFYNSQQGRIEMHLESLLDQLVMVGENRFKLTKGERIHTENSYKYSLAEFATLASEAGFDLKHTWVDGAPPMFAVYGLVARSDDREEGRGPEKKAA